MVNRAIPIDVLRAFIAVVNARGFTRAAEQLGRTQPTISLQVKRLEELIEAPLFENTTRLTLTRAGKTCLEYGHRVLREHDELFAQLSRDLSGAPPVRLGLPGELAELIVAGLGEPRPPSARLPAIDVTCGASEDLLASYRLNRFDIAAAATASIAAGEAAAQWLARTAWVGAPGYVVRRDLPLRLVTTPENTCFRQLAAVALRGAGRAFEVVCASADFGVTRSAIASGLGVGVALRGVAHDGLAQLSDESIVRLPDVVLGLYFRSGGMGVGAVRLASDIAGIIDRAGFKRG